MRVHGWNGQIAQDNNRVREKLSGCIDNENEEKVTALADPCVDMTCTHTVADVYMALVWAVLTDYVLVLRAFIVVSRSGHQVPHSLLTSWPTTQANGPQPVCSQALPQCRTIST